MPEVENDNYVGKDRRKNGARLRLSIKDWIYIGTLIITIILAVGKFGWTTEMNCKQIDKNTGIIRDHETKIAVIENSIKNIEMNVVEIKNLIKNKSLPY